MGQGGGGGIDTLDQDMQSLFLVGGMENYSNPEASPLKHYS